MRLGWAPGEQRRTLVATVQSTPGGPFGAWTDLGNPAEGLASVDPVRARGIGMPAPTPLRDGGIRVFVRNAGTGLSSRRLDPNGTWGPWEDHRGGGIQDGLAAVTLDNGRIEVFGSTHRGIARWRQKKPDGPFAFVPVDTPKPPAGPPTAVRGLDDRIRLVFREPDTARILVHTQRRPGGDWPDKPADLGGQGGFGPVAVAATASGLALAARNDAGTVTTGWFDGNDSDAHWSSGGPLLLHSPAVAVPASGGPPTAVFIAVDGSLHTARAGDRSRPGGWGPWARIV
jgi:hypothetical protein